MAMRRIRGGQGILQDLRDAVRAGPETSRDHRGTLHVGGLRTDNAGEEKRTQRTLSAGTSQSMAIVVMKTKVFFFLAHESKNLSR